MRQPRWNYRRVEVVILLAILLAGNILLGKLDSWLEKRGGDAWKGSD